jgi:hypothetical protein
MEAEHEITVYTKIPIRNIVVLPIAMFPTSSPAERSMT